MIMIMIIIIIIKQANDNKLIILKRQVFNDLFKVSIVADGLIDKGIVCHNIGAAIINAQSPIVFFVLNSRTYKGVGGGRGWLSPASEVFRNFFPDDKTSAPEVFSSCSCIPRTNFETNLVMASYYGYEI